MTHIIGDMILAATILLLAVQNYRNERRIENIEKWILDDERRKEL